MSPFGHTSHLRIFIDPDLLQYDEVWAAAGRWHDVFGIEPHQLGPGLPPAKARSPTDEWWMVRALGDLKRD